VAVGVFDGLHLGHQAVLGRTLADARAHKGLAVAVTFDRHPNAVVAPDRTPPLIQSLSQKLRGLEREGMDLTWLIPFDTAFSRIPAEAFIRDMVRDFGGIRSLCVGRTFTFGYKRGGDLALLERMGREFGFVVRGLAAVPLDGQPISSTRIREAIRAGDLGLTSALLGRPYSVAGRVLRGDQLGRRLGFPTANLDVKGLALPPTGVYAATVQHDGESWHGVLNIGYRPTLGHANPRLHFEVHILDVSAELYDLELEVTFRQRLRDERRFPSLDELREQIGTDIRAARQVLIADDGKQ
jgi:riboflavin kinase/FMN adenylyltransferase